MFRELSNILDGEVHAGCYLVQPTGKVLEEDKTNIEVKIAGRIVYAKPMMPFGWFNVPDEAWLEKYKGEIGIWVIFEHGNPSYPVWTGICPLDDKVPLNTNYPKTATFKTSKFIMEYDDVDAKFSITELGEDGKKVSTIEMSADKFFMFFRDGQGITMNSSGTELGKVDAKKEPALLGDTALGLMGEMLDAIAQITVVATAFSSPTSVPANAAVFAQIRAKLESAKSKSVKLD